MSVTYGNLLIKPFLDSKGNPKQFLVLQAATGDGSATVQFPGNEAGARYLSAMLNGHAWKLKSISVWGSTVTNPLAFGPYFSDPSSQYWKNWEGQVLSGNGVQNAITWEELDFFLGYNPRIELASTGIPSWLTMYCVGALPATDTIYTAVCLEVVE